MSPPFCCLPITEDLFPINLHLHSPGVALFSQCVAVKRTRLGAARRWNASMTFGQINTFFQKLIKGCVNEWRCLEQKSKEGTGPYRSFWLAIFCRLLPGSAHQDYLFHLLGRLCSHCKWTAPGPRMESSQGLLSFRWSWLACFAPHQSAIVAFTCVQTNRAKGKKRAPCSGTMSPIDPWWMSFPSCMRLDGWCCDFRIVQLCWDCNIVISASCIITLVSNYFPDNYCMVCNLRLEWSINVSLLNFIWLKFSQNILKKIN